MLKHRNILAYIARRQRCPGQQLAADRLEARLVNLERRFAVLKAERAELARTAAQVQKGGRS